MSAPAESLRWIENGDVRLEAMLTVGSAPLAALILHPHPQYGGDMHNHVVLALRDACAALDATTLRLNFRGVGGSSGAYDGGVGEATDAIAALAVLRGAVPGASLLLAGYSFGAMVAAAAASQQPVDALVLVSPPVAFSPLPPLPSVPTLVVAGDSDAIAPADAVRAVAGPGVTTVIVPGADHGWWPGLDGLVAAVSKFAAQAISPVSDA